MIEKKEHILLKKIAEGDEKAFRNLWDIYYQKLFHIGLYFVRSKELAEEAVTDVFFTLWQNRNTLSAIQNLRTYLYVSVKNQALQYLRRIGEQEKVSIDLYTIEAIVDKDNPESILLNDEFMALVQKAIDSLPPKCQEIFRLHISDKLKYKEIAEIMDMSEKTIGVHMTNAYKRISQYVNNEYSIDRQTYRMISCFF